MKKSLYDFLNESATLELSARGLMNEQGQVDTAKVEQHKQVQEALYNVLTLAQGARNIKWSEAVATRDFPQLLQTTLNDQLLLVQEPGYIGQTLLSQVMNIGRTSGTFMFPQLGYMEAGEVGEGQSYPEQTLEMNQNATSIAIKKFGIAVGFTGEMIEADSLGLYGQHIIAARRALNRLKEERIFSLFKAVTEPVFDNSIAFSTNLTGYADLASYQPSADVLKYATTGKAIDGSLNATLNLFDVIDTMSVVMARGYEPTDMLVNPLSWAIFAKNPALNAFYANARALPAQVISAPQFGTDPSSIGTVPLPWNMTMHVTPFVPLDYTSMAGAGAPFLTDIYIGSRQNGIIILSGSPVQQEAYENKELDIYKVRLREYYGLALADEGRAWAAIKNVRIADSYELVTTQTRII